MVRQSSAKGWAQAISRHQLQTEPSQPMVRNINVQLCFLCKRHTLAMARKGGPMTNRVGFILFAIFLLVADALPASARSGSKQDRVQFGSSISINEGEEVGDLVCIGCSVRVVGSCGDAVAIGGSVLVEGQVRGDVVAVGGGVRLNEAAEVSGDVVTVGGGLSRDPGSVVKGEIVSQGGGYVMPLLIIVPLIPVVLIVALIWWLISRSNRPRVPVQTYQSR